MTIYEPPPEPPIGTAVRDMNGIIYIRHEEGWRGGYSAIALAWDDLLVTAPLARVHIVACSGGRCGRCA